MTGVLGGEPVSLGVPVRSMTIWDSLVVREDDRPILYAGTYTGVGDSRVLRYDYTTNEVRYYNLSGTKGAYGLAWHEGTLYVGTILGARLFRVHPATGEVTDLGSAAPDEQYIWRLDRAPDGRLFAATYPGAKVLEYDPVSGAMRDHGSMHSGRQYAIALSVADDGRIFVGIGTPAALVVYDPNAGTREEIPLGEYSSAAFAYPLYDNGVVYVRFAGNDSVIVLDADSLEWLAELDAGRDGASYGYSRPNHRGPVLVSGFASGLKRYDRAAGGFVDAEIPVSIRYDPESDVHFTISPTSIAAIGHESGETLASADISRDGDGMDIMSVAIGPDGCVYGGVYNLLHLWRYDPKSAELADLGTATPNHSGQYYDFCNVGNRLYMSSYTHAMITAYDPGVAWNPGTDLGNNPRTIGSIGHDQYRPLALLAGGGNRVYIGSTPTYGQVGGALSVLDVPSDAITVHRHIVGDHSISSIAEAGDGTVYAGSTLFSSDPAHAFQPPEARLIAWNPELQELEFSVAPREGARSIHSLLLSGGERLHGSVDNALFVFDTSRRAMLHVGDSGVGAVTRLRAGPDGCIYGISREAVIRIKWDAGGDFAVERLARGGRDLAVSPGGDIYFARGPELFVLAGAAASGSGNLREETP